MLHNSGMALVRVSVTLKPALLDSAGRTVAGSLHTLGYGEVEGVRIGKLVEMEVADPSPERIEAMCRGLLANPVIEEYRYEVVGEETPPAAGGARAYGRAVS